MRATVGQPAVDLQYRQTTSVGRPGQSLAVLEYQTPWDPTAFKIEAGIGNDYRVRPSRTNQEPRTRPINMGLWSTALTGIDLRRSLGRGAITPCRLFTLAFQPEG